MSSSPAERGLFVSFEGGEGTGKSTQVAAVAERARNLRRPVVTCREPGGTALGERLRDALFAGDAPSTAAELLVFAAARAQLVQQVIEPALRAGALVLCDRFADSTVAYQQYGRGVEPAVVEAVSSAATGGLTPHLTALLDMAPEAALRRGVAGANYMEREEIAFHERVRSGYLELARVAPDRWLVLDATLPADQLTDSIWARFELLI